MPVEMVGVPTVREPDGLAMSSRNAYLSSTGRSEAVVLRKGLLAARAAARSGETDVARLIGIASNVVSSRQSHFSFISSVSGLNSGIMSAVS